MGTPILTAEFTGAATAPISSYTDDSGNAWAGTGTLTGDGRASIAASNTIQPATLRWHQTQYQLQFGIKTAGTLTNGESLYVVVGGNSTNVLATARVGLNNGAGVAQLYWITPAGAAVFTNMGTLQPNTLYEFVVDVEAPDIVSVTVGGTPYSDPVRLGIAPTSGDGTSWTGARIPGTSASANLTIDYLRVYDTGTVTPPPLTAGTVTAGAQSSTTTLAVSCTPASGGVPPYGYQFQRSAHGANVWAPVGPPGPLTAVTDTGLAPGTTYDYRVQVTDGTPTDTATSAVVTGTTGTPAALAAGAPSVGSPTQTTLTVTWPAATGGTPPYAYMPQRSANGTSGWGNLLPTPAAATTYTDTGLAGNTTYYYRVVVTDGTPTNTATSAAASGTTTGATVTPLSPGVLTRGTATAAAIPWGATGATGGTGAVVAQLQVADRFDGPWADDTGAAAGLNPTATPGDRSVRAYRMRYTDSATPQVTVYSNQVDARRLSGPYRIGWIGSSSFVLTDGGKTSVQYATDYLAAMLDVAEVVAVNRGVPGSASPSWVPGTQTLTDALAAFAAAGCTWVCYGIGVNDLGVLISDYLANARATCQALAAAGYKVLLQPWQCPAIGWGGAAAQEKMRDLMKLHPSIADGVNIFAPADGALATWEATALDPTMIQPDNLHLYDRGLQMYGRVWAQRLYEVLHPAPPAPAAVDPALVLAPDGTLTLPDAAKVLAGTAYGRAGTGSAGTLTLPDPAAVAAGTVYGQGGNGSTGALVQPTPAQVAAAAWSYARRTLTA
jgi:hypothetical protein